MAVKGIASFGCKKVTEVKLWNNNVRERTMIKKKGYLIRCKRGLMKKESG